MEVIANGVVHKSLFRLWFSPSLSFKHHVIVPSVGAKQSGQGKELSLTELFVVTTTSTIEFGHARVEAKFDLFAIYYFEVVSGRDTQQRKRATRESTALRLENTFRVNGSARLSTLGAGIYLKS